MSDAIAASQLRSFVSRIERLDEELKAINDDKKDVFAEARASGFDVKILKAVIAKRRKDSDEAAEFDTLFALYWTALEGDVSLAHDTREAA